MNTNVRSFLLVPAVRVMKRRKKVREVDVWRLIETRTGKIRCEMSSPEYVDCAVEAILLADRMRRNCANVGIFEPEMIDRYSFED